MVTVVLVPIVVLLPYYLSYQVSLLLIEHRHFFKDVIQRSSQGLAVLVNCILSLKKKSLTLSSLFESLQQYIKLSNLIGCARSLKFIKYFFFRLLMIPE